MDLKSWKREMKLGQLCLSSGVKSTHQVYNFCLRAPECRRLPPLRIYGVHGRTCFKQFCFEIKCFIQSQLPGKCLAILWTQPCCGKVGGSGRQQLGLSRGLQLVKKLCYVVSHWMVVHLQRLASEPESSLQNIKINCTLQPTPPTIHYLYLL